MRAFAAIALACLGLALAGCQTVKPAAPADVSATKIDTKIAQVSQQLAQYCTLVQMGITAGEAFSSNPKVDEALGYGKIAVSRFCAAPPSDTKTAIASLAAIAIDITNAVAAAKAPPAAAS